jgi:microcystin-dependent protein
MSVTVKPKRSYTTTNVPTLASGELGINAADGKIWIGNAAGNTSILVSSLAHSDHTGILTVANGGTGLGTLTANNVILGNGTSTPSFVAPSTSGNVLTSNGTTWSSQASVSGMPTGAIMPFAAISPPTGYLLCDGSAVSRSTYATLFSTITPNRGSATITIASPAVVTLSAHGFQTGDIVYFTTTGALPTGLTINTLYYVIYVNATTFRLATSAANAAVPTPINTSGTQSGTHTLFHCPYGLGDGSTTFNVPNLLQRIPMMAGSTGAGLTARVIGTTYGTETHTLAAANIPTLTTGNMSANSTHTHTSNLPALWAETGASRGGINAGTSFQTYNTNSVMQNADIQHSHTYTNASPTAINHVSPTLTINYIIKT